MLIKKKSEHRYPYFIIYYCIVSTTDFVFSDTLYCKLSSLNPVVFFTEHVMFEWGKLTEDVNFERSRHAVRNLRPKLPLVRICGNMHVMKKPKS